MIEKMLVLSKKHVSYDTALLLDENMVYVRSYKKEDMLGRNGWFVQSGNFDVPEDLQELGIDMPDDLKAVLEYAERYNCSWVLFDDEANPCAELPVYEWEDYRSAVNE